MSTDPKYYIHEEDRAALEALRSLPGFQQLLKTFMKEWSEKYARLAHMSGCIRVTEKQMPEYHAILADVCEKLGIEEPELYLERNVVPNAYTSGDTKPFIVMTTGLLETLPEHLIPTILAHECGHIACHHVLYRTMGAMLLNGTISALSILIPFGALISLPLEVAFYNWMRCSEYSADRAAILCDGTPDRMIEVCMRLAGYERETITDSEREEFFRQADEYEAMVKDSSWNRTMEFLMLRKRTHPFMAVRAKECVNWAESDTYRRILDGTITEEDAADYVTDVPEEPKETKKSRGLFDLPQIELPQIELPHFDFGSLWKKPEEVKEPPQEEVVDLTPVYRELRELKELVKEGVITEEEYNEKKKKLLGL